MCREAGGGGGVEKVTSGKADTQEEWGRGPLGGGYYVN